MNTIKRLFMFLYLYLVVAMPKELAWAMTKHYYPTVKELQKELEWINRVLHSEGFNATLELKE